eukprot:9496112-Pyramimonas_sp.AAC.1
METRVDLKRRGCARWCAGEPGASLLRRGSRPRRQDGASPGGAAHQAVQVVRHSPPGPACGRA